MIQNTTLKYFKLQVKLKKTYYLTCINHVQSTVHGFGDKYKFNELFS
jgi:hypothetical protein